MKLLEQHGAIAGYGANLTGAALGFSIEFFVEVSLTSQTEEAFRALRVSRGACTRIPRMPSDERPSLTISCASRPADAADYERIHRQRISRLPGIQRIQSSLALRTVKAWSGYPV